MILIDALDCNQLFVAWTKHLFVLSQYSFAKLIITLFSCNTIQVNPVWIALLDYVPRAFLKTLVKFKGFTTKVNYFLIQVEIDEGGSVMWYTNRLESFTFILLVISQEMLKRDAYF